MIHMSHKLTGDMEYLSKVYQWCCDQWPSKMGWEIVSERVNWGNGDLTVEYKFTDRDKSVLFCLVWMEKFIS